MVSPKKNDMTLSQFIMKRSTILIPLKIFLSGLLVLLLLSLLFNKAVLIQDDHLTARFKANDMLSHFLEKHAEEEREKTLIFFHRIHFLYIFYSYFYIIV